jgi:carboxymethylenebutenolidase
MRAESMGEQIQFGGQGVQVRGYLARSRNAGHGVIVLQEWWGLVPHITAVADRIAAEGFVALAPDLYHGQVARSPDEAGKLMMSLRVDDAARDVGAAIVHLLKRADITGKKIGLLGFCMGGALALFASCRNPNIGACAVFYGSHPDVHPDLASLEAPVLGVYGGRDKFVTRAVVAALDLELTTLGKRHSFYTYPNAQHAFFNDEQPDVYDAEAATDAWEKAVAFLHRELQD